MKEKVSVFVALAPVTRITTSQSPILKWLVENIAGFLKTFENLGVHYVLTQNWLTTQAGKILCQKLEKPCELSEFLVSSDPDYDDMERYKVLVSTYPHGASVKSILHFQQIS